MKIARSGKSLPYDFGADNFAITDNQLAFGLVMKSDSCERRNGEWVHQTEYDGGDDCVKGGSDDVFLHKILLREAQRCDDYVDQFDSDKRNDDAAESVDQQIAAQQGRR